MSSASSAVTYTSVYTDSEPSRAFWGADDEEVSEGGIPRVIVLGYDGLPIQPVAPPSPDYIPGLEDPQTPPVPQDDDEREPMFIQAHDPDYVLEPIYPEYIPLEDEHEFPAEDQPLPPVDSPTAESLGYVTESDPEEDPEEYEDDETEDGPIDYPMDGGDDGDDDNGNSSRDDANDEDADEEEEERLAPAKSADVVPTDEPASDFHILSPEAVGERLLALILHHLHLLSHYHHPPCRRSLAMTLKNSIYSGLIDAVTPHLPSPPYTIPLSLYNTTCLTLGTMILESSSHLVDAHDKTSMDGWRRRLCSREAWATRLELSRRDIRSFRGPTGIIHKARVMGDMQTELLALRGQRRARQPAPDARISDHQDASGDADSHCEERWSQFSSYRGCAIENQVKFATCTMLGAALTWWNGQIRTLGPEAYAMT
ncbi:hypothetical protein Tco_0972979 [Tanacetum coccineum]